MENILYICRQIGEIDPSLTRVNRTPFCLFLFGKSNKFGIMEEIWKGICGYEEKYSISNYGRVKSVGRIAGIGKGYFRPEKVLKLRPNRYGYLSVHLCGDHGKRKMVCVHHEVAKSFISTAINEDSHVCHTDGNKQNNYEGNLYIGDQVTNTIDKYLQKQTKLTMEQILEIRKIGKSMLQREIGDIYGVCPSYIGAILNKVKAVHVTEELLNKLKTVENGK